MLGRRGWRTSLVAVSFLVACGDSAGPGSYSPDGASDADAGLADAAPESGPIEPPPLDASDGQAPQDAGSDADTDAELPKEDDAGTPPSCDEIDCSSLDDACNVGVCDPDTIRCVAKPVANGTACGSDLDDACTNPDTCHAGVCRPNHASAGAPCGVPGVVCHYDDECDGAGSCENMGLWNVGTICGDLVDTECDNPDTCDAAGLCVPRFEALGAPCGDQAEPCRYDDGCNGAGQCQDGGFWAEDEPCGGPDEPPLGMCHPLGDVCDPVGTCVSGDANDGAPCGDMVTNTTCDKLDSCLAGVCDPGYVALGAPCGDQITDEICDQLDSCDGAGACSPNYADSGVVCDDPPGDCLPPPECSGGGACVNQPGFAPADTPCGDDGVADCDGADRCDAGGTCLDNLAIPGTSCGDTSMTDCSDPDSCDGSGNCGPNHVTDGATCGPLGQTCMVDDTCSAGACVDNGVIPGCLISVSGLVIDDATGAPLPDVTVVVVGSSPLSSDVTDVNGEFTVDVLPDLDVLLHFEATGTHWGRFDAHRFTADATSAGVAILVDDASAATVAAAVSGLPPLDPGKGIVRVDFTDPALGGGESVTLSASSAPSFTVDSTGMLVLSPMLLPASLGPMLAFINVATGATSVTPVGASGVTTCALDHVSIGAWPILARTVTYVGATCTPL